MRVIFVIPTNQAESFRLEDKLPFSIENLAIGYLSSHLSLHGIEFAIVDGYAHRMSTDVMVRKVLQGLGNEDVLAVTVLQSTVDEVRNLCRAVRAASFDGPIVLGGWVATMAPVELMQYVREADYVLRGEPETTFADFVQRAAARKAVDTSPGAVWRESGNRVVEGRASALVDFDWPRVPFHYGYDSQALAPYSLAPVPIQGSRGCYWGRCTFCSTAARYGPRGWRCRCAGSLIEEIGQSVRSGHSRFFFVDDEFFGPTERGFQRARELAEGLLREDITIEFGIDCLLIDFDEQLFSLLRRAGLRKVFLGVDSGANNTLKVFKKPFNTGKILSAVSGIRQLGLEPIFGFIMFEPYMSLEDVWESVMFLAHRLDFCGDPGKYLSKLDPEYGTELWSRLANDGLLDGAFPDWTFRFSDSRVARLYSRLVEPVRDWQRQYRSAPGNEAAEVGQRVRDAFLEVFQREYAEIQREPASVQMGGPKIRSWLVT